jgi:mono/diheme cytochrome c family protein
LKPRASLPRKVKEVSTTAITSEEFFPERQLSTRFGPRLKLLGMIMVLLGSALIAVSVEPESKEKWVAPGAEAQKKNPVAVNDSSLAVGQKIYLQRCVGCHGRTGKGDGPDAADLGIHPAKLSDAAVQQQTDGELFWKVTVGKKPMPNYRSRLSPTDRWNMINYLRTLAKR